MKNGREHVKSAIANLEEQVEKYEVEHGVISEDLEVPLYLIEDDNMNPEYAKHEALYEMHKTKYNHIPEFKSRLKDKNPNPFLEPNIDRVVYMLQAHAEGLAEVKEMFERSRRISPELRDIIFNANPQVRSKHPVKLQPPDHEAAMRNFEKNAEKREAMKKSLKKSMRVSPDFYDQQMTI